MCHRLLFLLDQPGLFFCFLCFFGSCLARCLLGRGFGCYCLYSRCSNFGSLRLATVLLPHLAFAFQLVLHLFARSKYTLDEDLCELLTVVVPFLEAFAPLLLK